MMHTNEDQCNPNDMLPCGVLAKDHPHEGCDACEHGWISGCPHCLVKNGWLTPEKASELIKEVEEQSLLIAKQAGLLRKSVEIVRGPPPEMQQWSVHDLPEQLKARLEEAERKVSSAKNSYGEVWKDWKNTRRSAVKFAVLADELEEELAELKEALALFHSERCEAFAKNPASLNCCQGNDKALAWRKCCDLERERDELVKKLEKANLIQPRERRKKKNRRLTV